MKRQPSGRVTPKARPSVVVGHRGAQLVASGARMAAAEALHRDRMRRNLSPKGQELLGVMDQIVDRDRKSAILDAAHVEALARRQQTIGADELEHLATSTAIAHDREAQP